MRLNAPIGDFRPAPTFSSVWPCRIVRLPIVRIGHCRGADGIGPPLNLKGLLARAAKCRGDARVAQQILVLPRIRDSIKYDLETIRHGNAHKSSLRTTIGSYCPDHGEPARAYVRQQFSLIHDRTLPPLFFPVVDSGKAPTLSCGWRWRKRSRRPCDVALGTSRT